MVDGLPGYLIRKICRWGRLFWSSPWIQMSSSHHSNVNPRAEYFSISVLFRERENCSLNTMTCHLLRFRCCTASALQGKYDRVSEHEQQPTQLICQKVRCHQQAHCGQERGQLTGPVEEVYKTSIETSKRRWEQTRIFHRKANSPAHLSFSLSIHQWTYKIGTIADFE